MNLRFWLFCMLMVVYSTHAFFGENPPRPQRRTYLIETADKRESAGWGDYAAARRGYGGAGWGSAEASESAGWGSAEKGESAGWENEKARRAAGWENEKASGSAGWENDKASGSAGWE